ncbi:MAG: OmpA family protein [Cardiobacteriaceae bacterium]|nr:OmpA family protein [Cardiobacteriaceae bacterium]
MKKMKTLKIFVACTVVLGMAGCSNQGAQRGGFAEQWTNFGGPISSLGEVSSNMAGTVVYRTDAPVSPEAVNVYMNGEYLGSLLHQGYKYAEVCPHNQRLAAAFTRDDPAYRKKENVGQYYDLPAGKISFFKIMEDSSGKPTVLSVDANTARQDMASLRKQEHTLSRVVGRDCSPQVLKKYVLEASALFAFDKSDYANILPQGKQQIAEVIRDINNYMSDLSVIYVEGHTDQQGSDTYNNALSQRRADTVKRIFTESGIPHNLIKAEGKGETQPVVTDCLTQHRAGTKALNQCNQPNRRVEITLYGRNHH